MKTTKVFDDVKQAAQFYADNGGFGTITQTLRGAVQHCEVGAQEDIVWFVEVEIETQRSTLVMRDHQFDE